MLLDLVPDSAVPGYNGLDPIGACLLAPNLCEGDENKMVLSFGICSTEPAHMPMTDSNSVHLLVARYHGETPPQTWRLLFGTARDSAFREMVFDSWAKVSLQETQSSASAETLRKLLDYIVSARAFLWPGSLASFRPGLPVLGDL
jgi:hypothetical protein